MKALSRLSPLRDHVEPEPVARKSVHEVVAGARASGVLLDIEENPHEMGSEKGNVKEQRKVCRPQLIEKNGSSGWIRTSNPPVNRLMQIGYLVGSSGV
jgi:hypothetical protein